MVIASVVLTWPDPVQSLSPIPELMGPGAPFELVDEEVLGARATVFRRRPRSIIELLLRGSETFAGRHYVIFPEHTYTFDSIIPAISGVAAVLKEEYGINAGDRVGIMSANRVEYVLTFWATVALGAVAVAFNGWWTAAETQYAVNMTEPKVFLADDRRIERLADDPVRDIPVVNLERDFAGVRLSGTPLSLPDVPLGEDDPFTILFTSGTTGRPKGAMLSHRSNIHFGLANQLQAADSQWRAKHAGQTVPTPPAPCSIGASPMFHIAGLTCSLVLAPSTGMTIVYPPPGRWSEETHLELTEKHRVTMWSLVPTQLWRLLASPSLDRYDLSSLVAIGGGSAVWPPEILRQLEIKLPWIRPAMGTGYGMTETNGIGTSLRGKDSYDHPDSIGRATATVKVEVRDAATRRPLPDGQIGEIALHSAATFVGYWRNPEATAKALDEARWYHTGDYGYTQDGRLYLAGRRQDLIIRGGENIYPVEVENRLFEHPDVAEVTVVGVEHAILGQEAWAYVVRVSGGTLTEDEAIAWCNQVLAAFKVPSRVVFVDSLPHNASGKILRHLIGKDQSGSGFVEE